jgi:hypothetical protein
MDIVALPWAFLLVKQPSVIGEGISTASSRILRSRSGRCETGRSLLLPIDHALVTNIESFGPELVERGVHVDRVPEDDRI